jgi:hypothetical protein
MISKQLPIKHKGSYIILLLTCLPYRLDRQNEMIQNAHRTILETEDVGNEVISELVRNREKIQSSRAKATDFAGITDSARRLLASMSRRDVRQRFVLLFIAAILIVAISITIYISTKK